VWGQRRAPRPGGAAALELRTGSGWRRIATVHSGTRGFFRWRGTLPQSAVVRLHTAAVDGAPLTIT
jgi:hypothetical protein